MDKHRDKKLDDLIGKVVEVVFFDDATVTGVLGYTPEYSAKYGYRRPNFYNCGAWSFRKSHVKRIRRLNGLKELQ